MATSKLWAVKYNLKKVIDYAANPNKTYNPKFSDEQYQALADVLTYAENEEKTEQQFFVQGINCNPSIAREQFVEVKKRFGKTDGIQAYHGYLSFKEQNITPEQAQAIGMEFAQRVWGERFQVVVTTHLNTQHLHCHFVINSISCVDGKRLQNSEKAWFKFRHIADELCKEHGLYYNPNPRRKVITEYHQTQLERAGMPTRYSLLREAIDTAIEHSGSLKEFEKNLQKLGYQYQLSESRKYWTVTPVGRKKPIRLINLGENYSNAAIHQRLLENSSRLDLKPFHPQTVVIRQYHLATREDRIKKRGGLYGMYLYYCYRLGYLPKYKIKQNTARLHYLLREDLMKLDKLTAETTLLGRENIQSVEQLVIYKGSVENEIKTLTEDRAQLYRQRRMKAFEAERPEIKAKISSLTDKLWKFRKELRLCDDILERSGEIKHNLEQVIAEEEKTQGKEARSYDQWR